MPVLSWRGVAAAAAATVVVVAAGLLNVQRLDAFLNRHIFRRHGSFPAPQLDSMNDQLISQPLSLSEVAQEQINE